LLETLVDTSRFAGTCYRAANWIEIGMTKGRGRMDRIYLYPLTADAHKRLHDL